jgi:hypothetical protein
MVPEFREPRLIKGRSSFLKKISNRLLSPGVRASRATHAESQKFFGSFFQKRTSLPSQIAMPAHG